MDCEVFEREFFGDSSGSVSEPVTVKAHNNTPALLDVQAHIHR